VGVDNEIRLRRFSASRISELLSKGKGITRLKYIYDLGAEAVGCRRELNSMELKHGLANQFDAFEIFRKYKGDCEWFDTSIPYEESLVATPDVISNDFVAEMKCQFSIIAFHHQNDTLPKKYFLQSQTQMLCAEKELGYVANYLSKPTFFSQEDWEEYSFKDYERLVIHKIERDDETIKKIIEMADLYHPMILMAEEMLVNATIIEENDVFYKGHSFVELRDIEWTTNKKEIFRFINKFFVTK
jgi:hypothetical protein